MNDEIWAKLTDSEKETWQHMQNMIGSVGWKLLERDLQEKRESVVVGLLNVSAWEQYCIGKGQLWALDEVLSAEQRQLDQLVTAIADREQESEIVEEAVEKAVEAFS